MPGRETKKRRDYQGTFFATHRTTQPLSDQGLARRARGRGDRPDQALPQERAGATVRAAPPDESTLVRLLSTLISDGGSARIFGFDVFSESRNVRRLVNRVSVEASFFKKMSANENLNYAARFYGMRAAETKHSIPEILDRVGFPKDRLNDSMEHLSRGMQQKVALARALLTSPVLLLLDEPTTGLDPRSKLEVQDFIAKVRFEHDATVVLCTHDMNEAEKLADRVGILDQGRLLVLEPADDLKKRYSSVTLEEAFFAATGKSFEEEEEEEGGET
ncbi:MAG: ABC transporter ATP-binding protein [Actinobacteria bacterium]|nr:ABC transporter ATP-binding protein [Actinomycetota bacterium]